MTYFELKISIKWANYAFIHSFQVIFAHSSTERNQYNIPVNVPVFESKHNLDWNITSTMRIIQKVPLHQVQQLYRKPYNSLYLYWNELNDWTLVWINQIWWFHSSMTCRQVLWSASLSLNVWDSQRDTSIIDFSEWWGMDWLSPRCFGGDPYE